MQMQLSKLTMWSKKIYIHNLSNVIYLVIMLAGDYALVILYIHLAVAQNLVSIIWLLLH